MHVFVCTMTYCLIYVVSFCKISSFSIHTSLSRIMTFFEIIFNIYYYTFVSLFQVSMLWCHF